MMTLGYTDIVPLHNLETFYVTLCLFIVFVANAVLLAGMNLRLFGITFLVRSIQSTKICLYLTLQLTQRCSCIISKRKHGLLHKWNVKTNCFGNSPCHRNFAPGYKYIMLTYGSHKKDCWKLTVCEQMCGNITIYFLCIVNIYALSPLTQFWTPCPVICEPNWSFVHKDNHFTLFHFFVYFHLFS